MELALNNGFQTIMQDEMEMIEGGGWLQAGAVFIGGVAVAWSPVMAFVCPPAAAGMALGGLGLIGKGTGAY